MTQIDHLARAAIAVSLLGGCYAAESPFDPTEGEVSAAAPAGSPATPGDWATLRGVEMGTAVQSDQLTDPSFASTVESDFTMAQAEYELKFGTIHPAEGSCGEPWAWQWAGADAIADHAASRGLKHRGHTFVWYKDIPEWLQNKSGAELELILEDHIRCLIARYNAGARRVFAWDVVNEIFDWDGDPNHAAELRTYSIWQRITDRPSPNYDYAAKAFRVAHEADPSALLFYNDYDAEELNRKSDAIYDMFVDFLRRKPAVPIHGLGMQMHRRNIDLESLESNIRRFTELGVKVQITEMDIRIPLEASAPDLEHQARLFHGITEVCLKYPGCSAVQTWGVSDAESWLPDPAIDGGETGHALLYDAAGNPKPSAYYPLRDALRKNVVLASANASLRGGNYAGSPQSVQNGLPLRFDRQDVDGNFRALLGFSLPNGRRSVRKAELKVSGSAGPLLRSYRLHGVDDHSWSERAVTWADQPAVGEELDTAASDRAGTLTFDVTAWVNREAAGGRVSLLLRAEHEDVTTVHSRESGGARAQPRLILYPEL